MGLALAVLMAVGAGGVRGDHLVVVCHPDLEIQAVTGERLRDVYMGKETSIEGETVLPVNFKAQNPLRLLFEREVLGVDPAEILSYWKSQRFLGFGDSQPVSFSSVAAVKKYVARQPGAVGYLPYSEVDESMQLVGRIDEHVVTPESLVGGHYPFTIPDSTGTPSP